jgi:hypothetical protein
MAALILSCFVPIGNLVKKLLVDTKQLTVAYNEVIYVLTD